MASGDSLPWLVKFIEKKGKKDIGISSLRDGLGRACHLAVSVTHAVRPSQRLSEEYLKVGRRLTEHISDFVHLS